MLFYHRRWTDDRGAPYVWNRREICVDFLFGNLQRRRNWEDMGVEGKAVLK